jgi:very-short-patch-repair endonuclease
MIIDEPMIDSAWKTYRNHISDVYKTFGPLIEKGSRVSPYELGIDWAFSPIEDNVWADIRFLCLPLYPQYPVGKFFLDFGDPRRKIGIEVDGAQWHKDKRKDRDRQWQIERLGWKVFRIPGFNTFQTKEDFLDEEGTVKPDFWQACSEGILISAYDSVGYFEDQDIYWVRNELAASMTLAEGASQ